MTAFSQTSHFPALRATQPARQIAHALKGLRNAWGTWIQARRQAREDRQMWSAAQADARMMADLNCALGRRGD